MYLCLKTTETFPAQGKQRAVAQADSGGRQGDAHGSARGRRQLDRVQKRRAASCAATAAQGAAHRLLLGGRGASGRRRSSAQERARVGAGAGTSRPPALLVSALAPPPVPVTILVPRPVAKTNETSVPAKTNGRSGRRWRC